MQTLNTKNTQHKTQPIVEKRTEQSANTRVDHPVPTYLSRITSKITITLGLLFLVVFAIWCYQAFERSTTTVAHKNESGFVLTNVNVLTMADDTVLEAKTVVVRNGIISDILNSNDTIPTDLPIIQGHGRYIMPGLIDLHVHVLDRSYAKSALAAGVTTVRNMGGFPYHLKWRDELENAYWYGANIVTSSPIMNSVEQGDPLSHFRVDDPLLAREAVRDFIDQGYDFIKVYEGLNAQTYAAILDEASKLNVAVAGHPSYDLMASAPEKHGALRTFEHIEEVYDGFLNREQNNELATAAAQFLSKQGVVLVPTLAVNRELTRLSSEKQAYFSQLDLDAINPFVRAIYEETSFSRWLNASPELAAYNVSTDTYFHELTRLMDNHNVKMGMGSDAGALVGLPGPASIDEMLLMAEAGVAPYTILKSATTHAADVLFKSDTLGQLAPGFTADMVVLNDNPITALNTLREPAMVIQNGRVFNQNDLRVLKQEAHEHANWLLSVSRHLNYLIFG